MRVYVAGPMSGLPDYNYPAFNAKARELRALGYDVENPTSNPKPAGGTWQGWMRLAIAQVITCDMMVMLPGWSKSKGATLEHTLATSLGMVIEYPEGM